MAFDYGHFYISMNMIGNKNWRKLPLILLKNDSIVGEKNAIFVP